MTDADWIRRQRKESKEALADMYEGIHDSKYGKWANHCDSGSCHDEHHGHPHGHGYDHCGPGGDSLYNLARFHANNIHNLMRLGSLAFGSPWGGGGHGRGWGRCDCPRCSPRRCDCPRCSPRRCDCPRCSPRHCDPCGCTCPRCQPKDPCPDPCAEPCPKPRRPDYVWKGKHDETDPIVYRFIVTHETDIPLIPVKHSVTVDEPSGVSAGAFETRVLYQSSSSPKPSSQSVKPGEQTKRGSQGPKPDEQAMRGSQGLRPGEQAIIEVTAHPNKVPKDLTSVTAFIAVEMGLKRPELHSIQLKFVP